MSGNERLGIVILVLVYMFLTIVSSGMIIPITLLSLAVGWVIDGYKGKK